MGPETHYTKVGDVHIAYQVVGDGPIDLVVVPGWVSHLEVQYWEEPIVAHFFERLAAFSRLILFDKRGTGLSDRVAANALPTLEQRMEDVRAVMDAVDSSKAALLGISEGGAMCALFAATSPDRVSALTMSGCFPKWIRDDAYPWAPTREEHEAAMDAYERHWGTSIGFKMVAPSVADDERCKNWWARNLRMGASPADGIALYRMNIEIDIRAILPTIHVPTLILHRVGDRLIDVGNSRYMAERIQGAKYVELEGFDHLPWFGDANAPLAEIQEFLTGMRPVSERTRVLATIMFTDIVGSTQLAQEIGDQAWKSLLDQHDKVCLKIIEKYRGRLISHTGDGVMATFDGPGRGIACAKEIVESGSALGLEIRSGLHTGECELRGAEAAGVAVHLASRVSALAGPGEVLVSRTVRDLVSGSEVEFEDRGEHDLRGFSEKWRLFAAA